MKSFDYLLTTTKKTIDEIKELVIKTNISGSIIVGNQLMDKNEVLNFKYNNINLTIYNLVSKGVSLNRNYLLSKSNSDYVTFIDDDMSYLSNMQKFVEQFVEEKNLNCVRFNSVSKNPSRPIRQTSKDGFVSYRAVASFGVCGCFYKRDFLITNNLKFDENVGPGHYLNHGEDGLFNFEFCKLSKIWLNSKCAFSIDQKASTWQGEKRDLERELISHGFMYNKIHRFLPSVWSLLFVATHGYCFEKRVNKTMLLRNMLNGIKLGRVKEYSPSLVFSFFESGDGYKCVYSARQKNKLFSESKLIEKEKIIELLENNIYEKKAIILLDACTPKFCKKYLKKNSLTSHLDFKNTTTSQEIATKRINKFLEIVV